MKLLLSPLVLFCLCLPMSAAADELDKRAAELEKQMTKEEKMHLVKGLMALPIFPGTTLPEDAVIGSGYVPGVPRLGIPALKETDAGLGVGYASGMRGDGATTLPSATLMGATWNESLIENASKMIGLEAKAKGYNVMLAGGVNITRDPRNGRVFEYFSEDPLLTGVLGGAQVRGIQSNGIISTLKHFAVNAQETGRHTVNSVISDGAARESDLLAFEMAIERGQPGSIMCAYNRLNGPYTCESPYLLTKVLKEDWGFKGWAMSDWGSVPGPHAALAGLDQQSGSQIDAQPWFGDPLQTLAATNPDYATRLSDMNQRILRSMLAAGLMDETPQPIQIDDDKHADLAQKVAEEGIVLLQNKTGTLPLSSKGLKKIAVIGGYAHMGVMSGGGSSQVQGPKGPAATIPVAEEGPFSFLLSMNLHRSYPLKAIQARAKGVEVVFNDGAYLQDAVRTARQADVVIVFATQWMMEGYDLPDLSLPHGQDALIDAVATANPNTVVVLETGGPIMMPWLEKTAAVVEAWYPGARGGEAIAAILFGDVNPSGRLPLTFPADYHHLPRPEIPGWDYLSKDFGGRGNEGKSLDIDYNIEGSDVGYRWFTRQNHKTLFPFGFGLSYTSFTYSDLQVVGAQPLTVRFTVTNTGKREGKDTPQVYLTHSPDGQHQRLLGWSKVTLKAGQSQKVTVTADPRVLGEWSETLEKWTLKAGQYKVAVGASAETMPLNAAVNIAAH